MRVETTSNRVLIRTLRGEPAAEADTAFLLDWARRDGDADALVGGLGAVAAARMLVDEAATARTLIEELVDVNWAEANITRARLLPIVTRWRSAPGPRRLPSGSEARCLPTCRRLARPC